MTNNVLGTDWQGVVWPGVTVFPDWFSANVTAFWNNEFTLFFNPETGVDIDALWIDMYVVAYSHHMMQRRRLRY